MVQHNKERIGKFTASRISELLVVGSGKTRQSYIYDVALESIGIFKTINTAPMQHGKDSEVLAFNFGVKPIFETAFLKSNEFFTINENLGCTTDVEFTDSKNVLDIKCPTIKGFLDAFNKSPKVYHDQIQTQLIGTGGELGYLFYYLTKPVTWDNGDSWEEYPFDNFDDNIFIRKIKVDESRQYEIIEAANNAAPERDDMTDLLLNAKEIEFNEFFNLHKIGTVNKVRTHSNILNLKEALRYEDEFYYFNKTQNENNKKQDYSL